MSAHKALKLLYMVREYEFKELIGRTPEDTLARKNRTCQKVSFQLARLKS